MIRESIEPKTTVWNNEHGFGKFLYFDAGLAVVNFSGIRLGLTRQELTEVEDILEGLW